LTLSLKIITHNNLESFVSKGFSKPDAIREIQIMLQYILGVDRAWCISNDEKLLSTDIEKALTGYVKRRLSGEPLSYIVGFREFYGLSLKTTPATLIPRHDTETLVDAFFEKVLKDATLRVLDLGTGTGAIALAIAGNRPNLKIVATDFSSQALSIAKENATNLDLAHVSFIHSDWFSALMGEKFDVILSNPPYIAIDDEHLKQGDLRFEPLSALASGADGLDDIRKIIQDAPDYLNPNGWLMLEHGYDQADAVAALLKARGFSKIDHAKDIAGTLRVTFGAI
jgi:release factor glutamine methyltransferase